MQINLVSNTSSNTDADQNVADGGAEILQEVENLYEEFESGGQQIPADREFDLRLEMISEKLTADPNFPNDKIIKVLEYFRNQYESGNIIFAETEEDE